MTETTTQTTPEATTEITPEPTTEPTTQTRYQCRHIHADGHRCGSPSLRRQTFCYYHHTTRKPIPRGDLRDRYADQSHGAPFDLPAPEDRTSIQLSIAEILRRIAAQQIDAKRAGLLLYGLQIASSNLPPHPRPAAQQPTQTQQTIEEIVEDDLFGPLAPESEFGANPNAPKSLERILMDQWDKDKEEWINRKKDNTPDYIWDEEQENWVLLTLPTNVNPQTTPATPSIHPEPATAILPQIQATADQPPTPNQTTHPTPTPTKKAVPRPYPALIPVIPLIPVTPCFTRPSHQRPPEVPTFNLTVASRLDSARQYPLCLRRNQPRPFTCPPSGNRTQPHGSHGRTTLRTGPANSSPSPGFTPKSFATSPA